MTVGDFTGKRGQAHGDAQKLAFLRELLLEVSSSWGISYSRVAYPERSKFNAIGARSETWPAGYPSSIGRQWGVQDKTPRCAKL
jgi:hypothetical protein